VEGSTAERTRLYRIIIARELLQIQKVLNIFGVISEEVEPFIENRNYVSFVIGLKSQKNLLKLLYENN